MASEWTEFTHQDINVWELGIAAGACGCMGESIGEHTKVGLCELDKKLFRAMVGHTHREQWTTQTMSQYKSETDWCWGGGSMVDTVHSLIYSHHVTALISLHYSAAAFLWTSFSCHSHGAVALNSRDRPMDDMYHHTYIKCCWTTKSYICFTLFSVFMCIPWLKDGKASLFNEVLLF